VHTVTSFAPLAVMIALAWVNDRWNKRPAVRTRWAALGLRDKITRAIRLLRIAIAVQACWLALFAGLRMSGLLSSSGWLAGTITAGTWLAVDLYLLRNALTARRAYDGLGPLAYLAEVQHAFGKTAPAGSDQSEDGVVNGWAWHTRPGEPCEACRLQRVHYDTCDCGHCPPAVPRGTVLHVSLADRLAATMPEVFGRTEPAGPDQSEVTS